MKKNRLLRFFIQNICYMLMIILIVFDIYRKKEYIMICLPILGGAGLSFVAEIFFKIKTGIKQGFQMLLGATFSYLLSFELFSVLFSQTIYVSTLFILSGLAGVMQTAFNLILDYIIECISKDSGKGIGIWKEEDFDDE